MNLRLTNGSPDLVEEGIDVAFQLAPLPKGLAGRYPELVELSLRDWRVEDRELYALYPATRQLSPKVRAVIDHALAARAAH